MAGTPAIGAIERVAGGCQLTSARADMLKSKKMLLLLLLLVVVVVVVVLLLAVFFTVINLRVRGVSPSK